MGIRQTEFNFFKDLSKKPKKLEKWLKATGYTFLISFGVLFSVGLNIAPFIDKIDKGINLEDNPPLHNKQWIEKNKQNYKDMIALSQYIDYSKGYAQYNEKGIVLKPGLTPTQINQFMQIAQTYKDNNPMSEGTIDSAITNAISDAMLLGKNNIKTKQDLAIMGQRIKTLYQKNNEDIQYRYDRLDKYTIKKLLSLQDYQDYLKVNFVEKYGYDWLVSKEKNHALNRKELKAMYQKEYQKLKDGKKSEFDDLVS